MSDIVGGHYAGRLYPFGGQYVSRSALYAGLFDMVPQLIAGAKGANARTAKSLIAFAEVMAANTANVHTKVEGVHKELASRAQQQTLVAYDNRRRGLAPYRVGTPGATTGPARSLRSNGRSTTGLSDYSQARYAGGVLRRAIASPEFVSYNGDSIFFGNQDVLNKAARQWKRLNFGAGGAAGEAGGRFSVRASNLELASLGILDTPQPGFSMPYGIWEAGKPSAFYPRGASPTFKATEGIKAEHWLDAGVRVIAEGMMPAYTKLWDEIYSDAKEKGLSTFPRTSQSVISPGRLGYKVVES